MVFETIKLGGATMWIFGNLFSKNPTILYTIDDQKTDKKGKGKDSNTAKPEKKPLIEDTEHLKKFFGME